MTGRTAKFCRPCWSGGFTSDEEGGGGAGSPFFVGVFATFADLETALLAGGVPDGALAMLTTASGMVGTWQVSSGAAHLVTLADITKADAATFRAGTDYILRDIAAGWETPGVGGGLTLSGSGLIEWPCFGLRKGYQQHCSKAYCTFIPGTGIIAQRMGVGSTSLTGDAFVCGGAWNNFGTTWQITRMWGIPSTMTSLSYAAVTGSGNRVGTVGAPLPSEIWLDQAAGGRDGGDANGAGMSRLTRDDVSTTNQATPLAFTLDTLAKPLENDHRFCVYFHDAASGDTSLRLRELSWDGVRP